MKTQTIENPDIDFFIHDETGGHPPQQVANLFRSVGIVGRTLVYFYVRPGIDITNLRDLIGKKIIIWTSPEGKEDPPFSKKDFKPSIYLSDWIYYQIFRLAGLTPENSTIINAWPEPITTKMEWDVMVSHLGIPSVSSASNQTRSDVLRGDIRMANIRDIQSVGAWRASYDTYVLPESALSITANIPQQETRLLSTYRSAAVRKDLDPSLVLGKPFLTNYVSPAFATFLMKIALVFIPLLTILWPITNLVPKIYSFYVKHKITHWYIDLELIDKTFEHADGDTRKKYIETIDAIRQGIADMRLPIMHTHYAQELFAARAHVDLIRRKINELVNLEAAKQSRTST